LGVLGFGDEVQIQSRCKWGLCAKEIHRVLQGGAWGQFKGQLIDGDAQHEKKKGFIIEKKQARSRPNHTQSQLLGQICALVIHPFKRAVKHSGRDQKTMSIKTIDFNDL
jgi:hypothetical protein